MFSESDFEEKALKITQEEKFIRYLLSLQQAMVKVNAKSDNYSQKCCPHYIARGMGLVTGEQNKKTAFYIYSTSKTSLGKDVLVDIRGPFSSYATVTIPAFRNSHFKQSNKRMIFENKPRKSFLQAISMDLINPENCSNVIAVKIEMETDRAIVTFIPRHTGMYQVILSSNGEHLVGSPYNLRILKNESGEDDFNNNDVKTTKKRLLSKITTFIDESFVTKKSNALTEALLQKDDDFEMNFVNKSKTIVIPVAGYSIRRTEDMTQMSPKITETKQIFEMNEKIYEKAIKEKTAEELENRVESNDHIEKSNSVEISPEKVASSICEMYIDPEEKSGGEIELSTFSVKENVSERSQENAVRESEVKIDGNEWNEIIRPPKKLKAFIKEKKDYWDHLILMNMENSSKSIPMNLNEVHLSAKQNKNFHATPLSKSLETLDRKLDFDFSLDKSVEDINIPSVRDRKSILIEQLTDEQKLLQMQNEKLKHSQDDQENAHKPRKPKRHESFSSLVDRIQMFNNGELPRFTRFRFSILPSYFQKNFIIAAPPGNAKTRARHKVSF